MPEEQESADQVQARLICRAFCDFLLAEVRLLDQPFGMTLAAGGELGPAVSSLLYGVRDSARSMEVLAGRGALRDCYVVSRTIIETIINACFMLARGEELARKALRHAQQKSYRDLERRSLIGQLEIKRVWSGKEKPVPSPELSEALQEFTTRRGKERTDWAEENLEKRLRVIEAKYGHSVAGVLDICLFAVYRHASEISHGTVFGAMFSLGLTEPGHPRCESEVMKYRIDSLKLLFGLLGLSIGALLKALVQEGLADPLVVRESEALLEPLEGLWNPRGKGVIHP